MTIRTNAKVGTDGEKWNENYDVNNIIAEKYVAFLQMKTISSISKKIMINIL